MEGGGGKITRGLGTGSPAVSRGGAPIGVWGRSSSEAEEFLKQLQANFRHFIGSISHIFTYILCLCFSVLAGIIPLSLLNGGVAFDTVCPLVCEWGANAPPPRLRRL